MKIQIIRLTLVLSIMAFTLPLVIAQDTTECEDGFRLFEDENIVGSLCVPETAERIITLDPFYSLQMSLEMGLLVIGTTSYSGENDFPASLVEDDLEGVDVVGAFETPNLEAITTLEPDLIIGDAFFLSEHFDLFNEIAPTVLINTANWKDWYRIIGTAAGVPERAETAFAEYNVRIADLQALIPDDTTISFLRVVPDGFQLYREAPNAYAPVAVMTEAGVTRPDFESGTDDESFARLDFEGLANIEGDILLYVISGESDSASQLEEETVSNSIWQLLPAVEAGQSYRVDATHWMNFGGLSSAHAVLDDLFIYVAGVDPQEVSPNPFLAEETNQASANTCEAGFYPVEHALGEVCVSDTVERVVSLEWSYTEMLLSLGVQPVGVADIEGYGNWVSVPVTLDADMIDVGSRQEPNLEVIAGLAPDLILVPAFRAAENYDELSAIAPTLTFDHYPPDGASHYQSMIDAFNVIATAIDREAEAETVLNDLQAVYDQAAEIVAEAGMADEGFILSQSYLSSETPTFRLFTDNAMAVEIIEQIGLQNAWEDVPGQYGFSTVDFEGFASIGDVQFLYIAQPEDNEIITDAPVWSALPFVQSEQAYWLGGDVWLFGGPLSAITLIETVIDALGLEIPSASG